LFGPAAGIPVLSEIRVHADATPVLYEIYPALVLREIQENGDPIP